MARGSSDRANKKNAHINWKHIADVCLSRAEQLLRDWLPDGKREGREWSAVNPVRADRKQGSFKVNVVSGKWSDFASGEKGGDLISLYAYLHDLDQAEAARELCGQLNIALDAPVNTAPPARAEKPQEWLALCPVPADAPPPPVAHIKRGKPDAAWTYRDREGRLLGFIWKFVTSDGGKEIVPLTFWKHAETGELKWRHAQWVAPRPLYGLDRLKGRTGDPVLIVEGEKCADAAHGVVGDRIVVLSWPGGGKAVAKADFTAISGCNVVTWADCDAQLANAKQAAELGIAEGEILPEAKQPGVMTMRQIAGVLDKLGCKVREVVIPKPGEKPGGWDVADAVLVDGWTPAQVWDVLKVSAPAAKLKVELVPEHERRDYGDDSWKNDLHWTDGRNARLADMRENVCTFFTGHPELKGLLQFDLFSHRVMFTRVPPWKHVGPLFWNDDDDAQAGKWLAAEPNGLRIKTEMTVKRGAYMAAMECEMHQVRDYLRGLTWDGVPRLKDWISRYMNAADGPYARAVSRFSLIAMVARVMQPGVWCRAMVIFLGAQNKGKSKAISIMARPWNADTPLQLGRPDAFLALRGVWGYEISEMDSFTRADDTAVKAFISSPSDRVRAPYGREHMDLLRQTVFWGTANENKIIRDQTGGTRYWPIDVVPEFDLVGLAAARDDLYAEAVAAYDAGEKWWPEDDVLIAEFTERQQDHTQLDAWTMPVANYINDDMKGPPWKLCVSPNHEFNGLMIQVVDPVDVLHIGLKMELSKMEATQGSVKRVERILLNLGFVRKKSGRKIGNVRPQVFVRTRERETAGLSAPVVGEDDVPM